MSRNFNHPAKGSRITIPIPGHAMLPGHPEIPRKNMQIYGRLFYVTESARQPNK